MRLMNSSDILPYETGEDIMGKMKSVTYEDSGMIESRFRWPRVLRLGSTAGRVLGLRVRIPLEA
jgi:hypothetical protein